ncbi:putative non-specific serine/threonine protein kinase [Lupinus albus]|uniref:Putative non-specific serine/threonine protein kinase n=1 Tax=Lupinus albus TaxID=3870 RepID=A0A6A4QK48_LUPAL|nr:putative non-specific serine/threonine protein kinase [Lupinus albus]
MGVCVSKPSVNDTVSNGENQTPKNDNKKSSFSPFCTPSPAHYFSSKKSPARSPANASSESTPRRFFNSALRPPSPAKHIKTLLVRRQGSVKPNEAPIPEGNEDREVVALDKNFGFLKHFGNKYEVGDEVGRGHFGYTCVAKYKKGELKGEKVAVKVISKAKV